MTHACMCFPCRPAAGKQREMCVKSSSRAAHRAGKQVCSCKAGSYLSQALSIHGLHHRRVSVHTVPVTSLPPPRRQCLSRSGSCSTLSAVLLQGPLLVHTGKMLPAELLAVFGRVSAALVEKGLTLARCLVGRRSGTQQQDELGQISFTSLGLFRVWVPPCSL